MSIKSLKLTRVHCGRVAFQGLAVLAVAKRASCLAAESIVSAPSEAWRFQRGESPCQGRANHPPVPSVAVVEEVRMD